MIYDYADILHIGEAGLEYVDEFQDICIVNFEACRRNAPVVLGRSNPGCVGRRAIVVDLDGTIMRQVEFFAASPVVFLCSSDADFRRLRHRVEQLGWQLA